MITKLQQVASQFSPASHLTIQPLGNGLINDTYLVGSASSSFVLQRINSHVFPQPNQVIDNLSLLGRHIQTKPADTVRLQIPYIIPTRQETPSYQDEEGHVWRALERIHPAESRNRIQCSEEAAQIGFALAHFHRLCADLSPQRLHDTLPGFHIAPTYLAQYQQRLTQPLDAKVDDRFRQCQAFIESHEKNVDILENAKCRGELTEYVIHGDPKLDNFLFRPGSHHVVSLIDLDTVKPGLPHYDIGDCLRSCCHDRERNHFDLDRCKIILKNYLAEAGDFFSDKDYDYLYAAIWLIPFELGLRFFSDHLSGNRYFKVNKPEQNLKRALAQFALCDSIERQKIVLQRFIYELKERHER